MCRAIFTFALIVLSSLAHAEVSDKMPSMLEHWLFGVPLGAVFFSAGYFNRILGYVSLAVCLVLLYGNFDLTFNDPVGTALIEEQGSIYFASLWLSDALVLGLSIFGSFAGYRKRLNTTPIS